jgi:hypothetical protein
MAAGLRIKVERCFLLTGLAMVCIILLCQKWVPLLCDILVKLKAEGGILDVGNSCWRE